MNKIKTISLLPILCGTLLCSKISYASEPIIGKEFLNIEDYKTFKPLNCKEETYFSIYSNENIKIKETQGWFWGSETKQLMQPMNIVQLDICQLVQHSSLKQEFQIV